MSDPSTENEPTMEEILASIRKIISEDEPEAAEAVEEAPEEAPEAAPEAAAEEEEADEEPAAADEEEEAPLELTQMVDEDGTIVDLNAQNEEAEPEIAAPDDEGETEPEAEEPEVTLGDPAPAEEHEGLVSPKTALSGTAAISWLSDALDEGPQGPVAEGAGKTIEALVRETITPPLKAWLDAHLPGLVERIVRDEIKKMVKRAEYR